MKRISLAVFLLFAAIANLCALTFADETISYKVMYKWGLINKQAGHATITLRNQGDRYVTQLTAASEPWADHFFEVRDTLNGVILKDGFRPLIYEKIAHEGGEHKHDVVRFSYHGNVVRGACSRRVVKKGREKVNQNLELESLGTTVDMLSSFYFMRAIPFDQWKSGQQRTVTIFSGKRKELLSFKYHGIETIKVGKREYRCYHITFVFTGDGGRKTSDDMDAWITADDRRIPVQMEGKLPVGKVRCQIM